MTNQNEHDHTPAGIIDFWIGPAADDPAATVGRNKLWYGGSPQTDAEVKRRFGPVLDNIEMGRLLEWGETATGGLALVIVMDQFTRNIYRGKREAFAQDALARAIAKRLVERGLDKELSVCGRAFLYHPFEHSEELADQDQSVRLFSRLVEEADPQWKEFAQGFVGYAERHRELIERFGRFPYRNETMGRVSTAEELKYLERGSRFGQ